MVKRISFVVLALSVLVTQTCAMSFVNNVTVPSDILTKMLLDEVLQNTNVIDASVQDLGIYNSKKCAAALLVIVYRFPRLEVLSFIDSWGKLPSGLSYGHLTDLGNFDQCVRTSVNLSSAIGTVNGKYCFASIPLLPLVTDADVFYDPQTKNITVNDIVKIRMGICIPDVCDPMYIQMLFQRAADSTFNGALSGIKVSRCVTQKKVEFETINIIGIAIFSIVAGLMALSTVYDFYTGYYKKPVVPILLAFSVYTNGRKLFAITTKKQPSIDCLIGIRVISTFWVIYCHNYVLFPLMSMINPIDMLPWSKAASSMHVTNGTVSVDTFLFISGLLVAWIGFRELDKRKGKLNIPLMYFHRYLRLTPALAAVILFYVSINKYIGSGPLRRLYEIVQSDCQRYWWSTLLYVQNYVNPEDTCITQTWYLAVDTQLYILSPLILIPLWKWGRKFVPVMVILSLASIGCVIATYINEGYNQFMGTTGDKQMALTYSPTHTRYTVWLMGIGFGYFLHKNKNKPLLPSKALQLLGWFFCFGTILAVIYGPYFTINADRPTTVIDAAIYECLKRIGWSVAVGWVIFACYTGFGGIINSFLSHPWWQPLGRLTYSLYLVHMAVQSINNGITRTDVYFSDYQMILLFWSTFGVSFMAAIVLTLAFESPIIVIEKILLQNNNSHQKENSKFLEEAQKSNGMC